MLRQEVVAWVEDWRQDEEELDRILGPAAWLRSQAGATCRP